MLELARRTSRRTIRVGPPEVVQKLLGELLASLFGTDFSLWNAREISVTLSLLFYGPMNHLFGTTRASRMWTDRGTTVPEQESNPNLFLVDRRRVERRILVNVPVEVSEVTDEGHPFVERTFIEDVSDFGCRFTTRNPLQKGDSISVKLVGSVGSNSLEDEPRLYEVMWVARKEHSYTVGARLLQGEKLAAIQSRTENGGPKYDPK
jgi:hypothetical protein